jgi:hypothetical protein
MNPRCKTIIHSETQEVVVNLTSSKTEIMKEYILRGLIILLLLPSVCVANVPFDDVDSTRKHKDRDASPHRLAESPTMNFSKSDAFHIDIGGAIVYAGIDGFGLSSTLLVGKSFFDGMLYVEGGVHQPLVLNSGLVFPINVAVRGALLSTEDVRLGLGYQYFDLSFYRRLNYSNPDELELHNIYAGFCWNPGNNSYVVNAGIDVRENGHGYYNISLGMSLSIGEYTQFIVDVGWHGVTVNKSFEWAWVGFRFFNETITWDLMTMFLVGYMLKVGIAL